MSEDDGVAVRRAPTAADAWGALAHVLDPEVPVLSVVELGIVRAVSADGATVRVDLTPTYSGCPAMRAIEDDVIDALRRAGFTDVRVRIVHAPAWTTDWIGAGAREKLREYGIAPPGPANAHESSDLVPLLRRGATRAVACPRCGSVRTRLRSEFGATSCKSIWSCDACAEPFEKFKEL